jgi:hypothetical protein
MSIPSPQTELPRDGIGTILRGGADLWDEVVAGEIIAGEFFEAAPPPAGNKHWIKVGGVWKEATTWIRVGGVWKTATPKTKVGGTWQ